MCGIAGIVGSADTESARLRVEQMVSTLVRRGPDAGGVAALPGGVLGHRRLAIFDLSDAGAQPMASEDGSLSVVFNGAIYNFRSLRAELSSRGCRFHSETDTEVLLHGYRVWGIAALVRRLRGMFAFGLWDSIERKLFLVRDRLGVKPLVYASRGNELAFASTVSALERGGFGGDIDEDALLDLLRWGFVGEGHCIARGIRKLPAATILEWRAGKSSAYRYWDAPVPASSPRLSFQEAVAAVEERFCEAVALRLDADVPVAVLLSGGIDSSLICWAVAKSGADITAYTVGVPGDPWDESAAAVATARRLGIRHRVLPLGNDQIPDLDELLSAYDEPFVSSSAFGMLRIAQTVGASAKVVLTGDGGDDLFLGYPRHRHLWLAQMLSHYVSSNTARSWARRARGVGPLRRARALLDYTAGGVDAYLLQSAALAGYREKNLLGPRFQEIAPEEFTIGAFDGRGMVESLVDYERRGRFVGEYLKKVDGATMYFGIEARAPFLDQELWQVGGTLPVDLRLRRGELKAILRTLARRHLGIGVAARRKRGFRIPAQRWLATHWLERGEQTLQESLLAGAGWINGRNVLAELRRSAQVGRVSDELWNIFVIESWLQHHRRDRLRSEDSTARSARRVGAPAAQGALC